ncbi:MAG: glycosyltransferase [Candidatus Promineifilaceae bacterium]
MRVLMITSEWPTVEHPEWAVYLVQRVKFLRQAGIEVDIFAFRGRKHPLNYLKAWWQLRQQFKLKTFDVIDAQFGQSGLVALFSPKPVVVTFHGSDLQGFIGDNGQPTLSGRILQMLSRLIARYARQRVVVSEHLLAQLPASCSAHVIPCGLDFRLFHPMSREEARTQLSLPKDKQLILFAANPHNPIKRFHLARAAVALLPSAPQAELITVTNVPHEKMPLYMNACDVLLVTSKHEGSPMVIKEALACNLAIVATDVGDIRQRIAQVKGCFVVNEDSPECIAAALQRVLANGTRINGMETMQNLNEEILVQQMIQVYHLALEKTG